MALAPGFSPIVLLLYTSPCTNCSAFVSVNILYPKNGAGTFLCQLFRFGDNSSVINYRLIFLLCILAKVLQYLTFDKIVDLIASSTSNVQSGFLKSRSTVQQLPLFLNYLLASHSQKTQLDPLYLDFSKAFDKVPHDYLLIKHQHIEIQESGSIWLFLNVTSQTDFTVAQ